jgi:uncharacterized membrane protein
VWITDRPDSNIHQFTPYKYLTPYSVFVLYFAVTISWLVEETNQYYQQYIGDFHDGLLSPVPDITESEIILSNN